MWNYTFDAWSEIQADKYYKLILNACAAIAKKPQQGKVYEEIYPNLKGKKEIVKIVDLMGRETKMVSNTSLIFIYSDGTMQRVMEFEK